MLADLRKSSNMLQALRKEAASKNVRQQVARLGLKYMGSSNPAKSYVSDRAVSRVAGKAAGRAEQVKQYKSAFGFQNMGFEAKARGKQSLSDASRLRKTAAMMKEAGLLGGAAKMIGRGALRAGKMAVRNPGKTLVTGLGVAGAVGKAKSTTPGFNPAIHAAQLGMK